MDLELARRSEFQDFVGSPSLMVEDWVDLRQAFTLQLLVWVE